MMYLSKEATNKDQSLEMQMLLSLHNNQIFGPKMGFSGIEGQILLFLS